MLRDETISFRISLSSRWFAILLHASHDLDLLMDVKMMIGRGERGVEGALRKRG